MIKKTNKKKKNFFFLQQTFFFWIPTWCNLIQASLKKELGYCQKTKHKIPMESVKKKLFIRLWMFCHWKIPDGGKKKYFYLKIFSNKMFKYMFFSLKKSIDFHQLLMLSFFLAIKHWFQMLLSILSKIFLKKNKKKSPL
jgi:hypothetical protein